MNGGKWFARGSSVLAWGVLVGALSILVLQSLGWWPVQEPILEPWSIAPATAGGLALDTAAILLARPGASSPARRLGGALAVAGALVMLLGRSVPGGGVIRPAYNTTCAITLLSAAVIAGSRSGRTRTRYQFLALASGLIASLAVAGYVFDSPLLYRSFEHNWGMALVTAVLLLMANAALLAARPNEGIVAPLAGADVRGRILRRFLPTVFGIPVFALLLESLARRGSDVVAILVAVLAVAAMILTSLFIAAFARRVASESAIATRLASLVEHCSDAVVDTTLDGRVLQWNPSAVRMYGYSPAEMIGRPATDVVAEDERGVLVAVRAAVLRDGRGRVFEGRWLRKDGTEFFASTSLSPIVDGRGAVVGVSAVTRDLSERVAAEQALRRAHESAAEERAWIEAVVDQMPEPVVLLDADCRVRHVNRAASGFRSAPEAGVPGAAMLEIRQPDGSTITPADRPLSRALTTGRSVEGEEVLLRTTAGDDVPMLASAAPVFARDGALIGAAQVYQDIRPIKQLERMREEWTSVVAHDLRQPVTVIGVTARTLRKTCAQNETARPQVERVARAARQLERMIADLLDVSQLESRRVELRRAPCELGPLLRETVDDLREVTRPGAVFIDEGVEPMLASVDPARFAQVLGNLLSNATKYGAPGTSVRVTLRREGERARITVSNRGPGIPQAEIARLFERFQRSSATRRSDVPGLGLGLFIARELVRAHGGQIWAESVPGEWTSFHVELPLLEHSGKAAGVSHAHQGRRAS